MRWLHPGFEDGCCVDAGGLAEYFGELVGAEGAMILRGPGYEKTQSVAQRSLAGSLLANAIVHLGGHERAAREEIQADTKIVAVEERTFAREFVE